MKVVTNKDGIDKPFSSFAVGECFLYYTNDVAMKTNADECYLDNKGVSNAVCLSSGRLLRMGLQGKLTPLPNATVLAYGL